MNRILLISICIIYMSCRSDRQKAPTDQSIESPIKEEILTEGPNLNDIKSEIKPADRFTPPEGWQEITADQSGFFLDIRYATDNNFVDEVMYDCGNCFLRREAAEKLFLIRDELQKKNLAIKLFDCYRPAPVQERLWEKVPDASYVTPPWRGSQHNRGVALDLTLTTLDGAQLDMGTAFDYFGEEAHHTYTKHSDDVQENRTLLKTLMEHYGFSSIRTEWWHYSIASMKSLEVSRWEWDCE